MKGGGVKRKASNNATASKSAATATTQSQPASILDTSNLRLERVLGLSATRPSSIAVASNSTLSSVSNQQGKENTTNHHESNINNDVIAFAAGGVAVVYSHSRNRQTRHFVSQSPAKAVACLTFSRDGNLLAVGEAGHQPRIHIWDHEKSVRIAELANGHKFGVLACAFSPNSKFLVSVGFQHDGFVYIWNVQSGLKVACNRISAKVNSLQFDDSGRFFATSGFRHFKYWNFDSNSTASLPTAFNPSTSTSSSMTSTTANLHQTQVPIVEGVFATVGEHKNSTFMDIAFFSLRGDSENKQHAYSITEKGILVLFNEDRVMEKWVDLKVRGGLSIAICRRFIVCGCTDGIIRLFEPSTMKYIATLPKPHHLGIDVAHSLAPTPSPPGAVFPDAVAVKVDAGGEYVTAAYSDASLFVWDVRDTKHVGKYRSFLNHCDCVWGVEMFPAVPDALYIRPETPAASNPPSGDEAPRLPPRGVPPNSFVTYGSDLTVRFWNVDHLGASAALPGAEAGRFFRRNMYSKEAVKIVYTRMDEFLALARRTSGGDDSLTGTTPRATGDKLGIRSLRISESGRWMAIGDRSGNLKLFELETFTERQSMEAHDGEILGIDFSYGCDAYGIPEFMATASRDRLIHIFDVRRGFDLVQTLEDHTSSITAIKFSEGGRKLLSCAADKSIVFRALQESSASPAGLQYTAFHNSTGRSTVFDLDADSRKKALVTVTQDRRLALFHTGTGKPLRSFQVDDSEGLLKVHLELSGRFAVTAAGDKCIRVIDVQTGAVVAKVAGHSEIVTGVKFCADGKRVVSTSADGCVFVWRVGGSLLKEIEARVGVKGLPPSGGFVSGVGVGRESEGGVPLLRTTSSGSDFMAVFEDDGGLPGWARAAKNSVGQEKVAAVQKGLWASRVQDEGVKLFTEAAEEPPVARINNLFDRRYSIETFNSNESIARAQSSGSVAVDDIDLQDVDEAAKEEDGKESNANKEVTNEDNTNDEDTKEMDAKQLFLKDDTPSNSGYGDASAAPALETTSHLPPDSSVIKADDFLNEKDLTTSSPPAEAEDEPEATIFVEADVEDDVAVVKGDAASVFAISESVVPTASTDELTSSDDAVSEPPATVDGADADAETSSMDEKQILDPSTGKRLSLEEYLNAPLDSSLVRQSISAKHIMTREASRNAPVVVDTVLAQIRNDQANFERKLLGGAVVADTEMQMTEPGRMRDLKSPVNMSPIQMNRVMSAVNREVIIEAVATVDETGGDMEEEEGEYDNETFENVDEVDGEGDDEIDNMQVLKDLKKLRNLTESSASILKRLQWPPRNNTLAEAKLSEELRATLTFVQESASEALRLSAAVEGQANKESDNSMAAALEKYSTLLVGMVREKLAANPVSG
ncbi:quinon protein alcohol dehydrogenase-like superfamily [Chytriomyces sp. MP71]|nr:quinon protein alcohol dehydrogenase-like superfamily [Chytriomyces sp. MP71]